MKKLFVFAVAFIAFTGFTFSGKNDRGSKYSAASISASTTEHFSYFRIHHQTKKNVVLNWGITTPAGVSSFVVERSYDGDFYESINQVNCNNSVKFSWKDEGVYPGIIYYRIGCIMNDGSSHYSEVETIRIVQR